MVHMYDVREQTKPVMEYIHTLENLVRMYRNQQRVFWLGSFFMGLAVGALAAGAVCLVMPPK